MDVIITEKRLTKVLYKYLNARIKGFDESTLWISELELKRLQLVNVQFTKILFAAVIWAPIG